MRTETITRTLYTFDELSEDAQQRAIDNIRDNGGLCTDHLWNEGRESAKEFCNFFGIDSGHGSWLDFRTGNIDDNICQLSGQRLRTYLLNNYSGAFYERKYRGHSKQDYRSEERPKSHRFVTDIRKDYRGHWYRVFRSNFEVDSCCPFTGVCYDDDLLRPLREFIKKPDNRTFDYLIAEAEESLKVSLENEAEFCYSDEGIIEHINANDLEFTEAGERA